MLLTVVGCVVALARPKDNGPAYFKYVKYLCVPAADVSRHGRPQAWARGAGALAPGNVVKYFVH